MSETLFFAVVAGGLLIVAGCGAIVAARLTHQRGVEQPLADRLAHSSLPARVHPLTIVFGITGLVVVLATAWVWWPDYRILTAIVAFCSTPIILTMPVWLLPDSTSCEAESMPVTADEESRS